ncbi:hypothetical protein ACFE04_015406 [Oxalis oulophora]
MANSNNNNSLYCDFRIAILVAALIFFYIQFRLFTTQSEYADRLTAAVESENHCTSQMRLLIDQISMQQSQIVSLQEETKRQQDKSAQLKALLHLLEKKGLQRLMDEVQVPVAAVVIMACNRADYLERTIESVFKHQKSVASKYPLFVSQDGTNSAVRDKALSYDRLTYMQHLDYEPIDPERPGELLAYYKIARHYKWALDELFYKHNFTRTDDMEISPDFFDYFEAAAALMDKDNFCSNSPGKNHDRSIMAASSWNDNGQKQFVYDAHALYRSDFFPGLGWMLTRTTWDELSPKWPKWLPIMKKSLLISVFFHKSFELFLDKESTYWDDWLRLKENHKGRQFIRPEVCRTYNFGEHGSSLGQFFSQYLEPIKMNDVQIDWKSMDLSYLMEDKYPKYFADMIRKAKPVRGADLVLKTTNIDGDVRIQYNDQPDFERIARQFGIFEEWKDGVPRTAYKGIVVFRFQNTKRVFLVGPNSLEQLGIENA